VDCYRVVDFYCFLDIIKAGRDDNRDLRVANRLALASQPNDYESEEPLSLPELGGSFRWRFLSVPRPAKKAKIMPKTVIRNEYKSAKEKSSIVSPPFCSKALGSEASQPTVAWVL